MIQAGLLFGFIAAVAAGAAPNDRSDLDYVKIASATDGRCTAVVKREGQLYSFEVIGLEPNESFPVASSSADETIKYVAKANADGYYLAIISPNVKGRSSGIAHMEFRSSRCRIHISFPWRDD